MAAWKKTLVVALAAVVGVLPAFAQVSVVQAVPAREGPVTLPVGNELTNAELLEVQGEADPLTVLAAAVVNAGLFAATDLVVQAIEIAFGRQSEIDLAPTGIAAGLGAITGPVLAPKPVVRIVRAAIVQGARWTARTAATVGTTVASFSHRVHEALHAVHVTLHTYVREPVANAFRRVWDWLNGR